MEYHSFFKCRLCGEIYDDKTVTSNKDIVFHGMIELALNIPHSSLRTGVFPSMNTPHSCKDGSYGMADFIGFKAIDDK